MTGREEWSGSSNFAGFKDAVRRSPGPALVEALRELGVVCRGRMPPSQPVAAALWSTAKKGARLKARQDAEAAVAAAARRYRRLARAEAQKREEAAAEPAKARNDIVPGERVPRAEIAGGDQNCEQADALEDVAHYLSEPSTEPDGAWSEEEEEFPAEKRLCWKCFAVVMDKWPGCPNCNADLLILKCTSCSRPVTLTMSKCPGCNCTLPAHNTETRSRRSPIVAGSKHGSFLSLHDTKIQAAQVPAPREASPIQWKPQNAWGGEGQVAELYHLRNKVVGVLTQTEHILRRRMLTRSASPASRQAVSDNTTFSKGLRSTRIASALRSRDSLTAKSIAGEEGKGSQKNVLIVQTSFVKDPADNPPTQSRLDCDLLTGWYASEHATVYSSNSVYNTDGRAPYLIESFSSLPVKSVSQEARPGQPIWQRKFLTGTDEKITPASSTIPVFSGPFDSQGHDGTCEISLGSPGTNEACLDSTASGQQQSFDAHRKDQPESKEETDLWCTVEAVDVLANHVCRGRTSPLHSPDRAAMLESARNSIGMYNRDDVSAIRDLGLKPSRDQLRPKSRHPSAASSRTVIARMTDHIPRSRKLQIPEDRLNLDVRERMQNTQGIPTTMSIDLQGKDDSLAIRKAYEGELFRMFAGEEGTMNEDAFLKSLDAANVLWLWPQSLGDAAAKAAGRNFFLNDALQIFKACTNAATLRALDLNGFLFACEAINVRLAACNQSVGGNYLRLKLAREESSQPSKGSVPVTSLLQRRGAPQGDQNGAQHLRSSRNSHSLRDRSPAHRGASRRGASCVIAPASKAET